MGIKFKQIDNLQSTFDALSGDFQNQITTNSDDISGVYNDSQILSGWKYFANNVDISGAQGLLVSNDNIYTPNYLIASGAKLGFPIGTPRNSTSAPEGSLQVSGGQIYFEDQLNIRNNAGINITNGAITGNTGDFDYLTGSSLNYLSGAFSDTLTISGVDVATGVFIDYQADSGIALVGSTFITQGTGNFSTIDFESITAPAHQEGRLFYDTDNLTLTLYNDEADISLQVGQEEYLRVRNNTTGTISNGSVVRINGSQGTHPTIDLASADSEEHAQVIGLATHDIEAASFGYVTTYGIVRGLNTQDYDPGDEIHLSVTSGEFTSGQVISPNYRVTVGHVLRDHLNQGTVLVQPGQAKLGGGDVKNLKTVNISGITFFEEAVDGAGIICSKDNFVFDTGTDSVGIGTTNPQAALDVYSTNSAILHPRLSTDQMTGISSPVNGMVIYNTDVKKFAGYSDNSWSLLQEEWTPQKLTLNAWYDAADLATLDLSGNYVSTWRDKSFKGNHTLQSDTGKQPVAYEKSHNGLNVLDFTPDDHLISNDSTIENQDQTWIVLANITNVDSSADSIVSYHDGINLSGSWQLQANNSTEFRGKVLKGLGAGISNTAFSDTDLSNTYNIFTFNFDRQNQQHSNWLNGSINDSAVSDVTGIFPSMDIKIMTNRGTNNYPEGQVAEIICFSGISTEDKEKAEGYLAHKWNLTGSLPDSHPYKYIRP